MKKLTVFLLLLALVLPGCAAPAASQPGSTQQQPQTQIGGTQEQTLPQSSGEKEPFTDTSFLFQPYQHQQEVILAWPEVSALIWQIGEQDEGKNGASFIYHYLRLEKTVDRALVDHFVAVCDQQCRWYSGFVDSVQKYCLLVGGAEINVFTTQLPGEEMKELVVSDRENKAFTVYVLTQDSTHYANDSRVFEIAQENKDRLQSDLRTLPNGTGREYLALDEDVVCAYQDGVLKGFVMKQEGRLVAIEFPDLSLYEDPQTLGSKSGRMRHSMLSMQTWQTEKEQILAEAAKIWLPAFPAEVSSPSVPASSSQEPGVPTSTEG